jgi:hypothetical protein
MDTKAKTYRTTAKVVGALYILGFIVGIAGSVLGTPGQLDTISARSMMIAMGALLWVLAAAGDDVPDFAAKQRAHCARLLRRPNRRSHYYCRVGFIHPASNSTRRRIHASQRLRNFLSSIPQHSVRAITGLHLPDRHGRFRDGWLDALLRVLSGKIGSAGFHYLGLHWIRVLFRRIYIGNLGLQSATAPHNSRRIVGDIHRGLADRQGIQCHCIQFRLYQFISSI